VLTSPITIPLGLIAPENIIQHLEMTPLTSYETTDLFLKLNEDKSQLGLLTSNHWLKLISKSSFKESLLLIKEMKNYGVLPTASIYTSIITSTNNVQHFLSIHKFIMKRQDRKDYLTNEYLFALVNGLLSVRREDVIPEIWDDMKNSDVHFNMDLLQLFVKATAIIKGKYKIYIDADFLIVVHKFLIRRLKIERWPTEVYYDFMEAFANVEMYPKVIEIFSKMGKIPLCAQSCKSVLPSLHYMGDKHQIHMLGKIILRDNIEVDTNALQVLISDSINLGRVIELDSYITVRVDRDIKIKIEAAKNEKMLMENTNNDNNILFVQSAVVEQTCTPLSFSKLYNSLIDAYAIFDHPDRVLDTLKRYHVVRKELHEGISTKEICHKLLNTIKTEEDISFLRDWNPSELPRSIIATAVSYFASKRDSDRIIDIFNLFILNSDLLSLLWSRTVATKFFKIHNHTKPVKKERKSNADSMNTDKPDVSLKSRENDLKLTILRRGASGPLKVVYERITNSWTESLEIFKDRSDYSYEIVRKNELLERLYEIEVKALNGSIVEPFLFDRKSKSEI
jgi:hypothetical protein